MNAPVMQPGIISGLPFSIYLSDPCPAPSLSSGGAHTILSQSPAHCWADHPRNPKRIPGDESTDMDIGSIAHELLLSIQSALDLPAEAFKSTVQRLIAQRIQDTARGHADTCERNGRLYEIENNVGGLG